MKIVAVTSCPTGIAHTYMAAESLEQAAKAADIEIVVETQGAGGATPIDPATIAAADAVIFAADVEVRDRERFAGKPLVQVPVKQAINGAPGLIDQARQAAAAAPMSEPVAAAVAAGGGGSAGRNGPGGTGGGDDDGPAPATKVDHGAGFGTHLRQWLMTGVSYMIPFVAAGGILIAISFMWGGAEIANKVNGGTFQGVTYEKITDLTQIANQVGYAGVLFKIGDIAFTMLVPILAGFIAYAMVDRPGLVPGIVGGLLATAVGAGFLGGLAAGLIAGGVVMLIMKVKVPRVLASIMPVLVIPLVSTAVVGFLMIVVLGKPIASLTTAMTDWLAGLGGSNAILLGALLGLMMAFDMGGPVNKVAYTFGLASLASGNQTVMAAVMAAGMTPPLGLALATAVRPKLFNRTERQAGEAAWVLGASFVTEGAIPFAAADPLRVIPSIMLGSGVAAALSMAFDVTSPAPHGGIWVLGLVGKPVLWFIALAAGTAVTAACVVAAKALTHEKVVETEVLSAPTSVTEPAPSNVAGLATR